jgi:hypothetical protein
VANKNYRWDAEITRTDSTFDINTRQIDVVAEVYDPFGITSKQAALKIGQFVSARIQGRTIEDVFVIPNKSIREGRYVYAVRDGKLTKQSINILWQDDQNALISEGIENGELVVTTSLNSTLAGAVAKFGDDDSAKATDSITTTEEANNTEATENADANIKSDIAEPTSNKTNKQVLAVAPEAQAVVTEAQAVVTEAQAVISRAQAVETKIEADAVPAAQADSTQ